MSDTAVSSQIATQTSPSKGAELTASPKSNSPSKAQASEFDDVLGKELDTSQNESTKKVAQEEALLSPPLLIIDPLLTNEQNPLSAANGNALPASPLNTAAFFDELLMGSANLNPANTLAVGLQAKGALPTGNVGPDANVTVLAVEGDVPIEEDFFTSKLNSSLVDKELSSAKQLNAQIFNQLMNQSLNKPQANIDNSMLPGTSGMIVSQSVSTTSTSVNLPAINVSPENAQWNSQVGERINWMVNNNMQRAEIRLDPPELGNLDIRLNITKDNQASILIHVTNAGAKEAIESAIPRLREMFEQQGLDLANVDVSQQDPRQQSAFDQFGNNESDQNDANYLSNQDENDSIEQNGITAVSYLQSNSNNNLLDLFA